MPAETITGLPYKSFVLGSKNVSTVHRIVIDLIERRAFGGVTSL
jgi:hypothetical protein